MTRVVQPQGVRGSLRWIQRAINQSSEVLDAPILECLTGAHAIAWRSPLEADGFAEYRDDDFLGLVGLESLSGKLRNFWPQRGPQWDALGVSDMGHVLLVEAKAHIDELCSPGTDAGPLSRAKIEVALAATIAALEAAPRANWAEVFYQYANRLAHLHFLRSAGVDAWLVLANFIGDTDMSGPVDAREWKAAYRVVDHVLGIKRRSPLMRHVIHVYPDVAGLG
jgi:hypothetical protein